MTVFKDYAKFYDSFYREKDYMGEVDYLERLFKKYAQQPIQTILDLGCGTGGHVFQFAQRGYTVCGVDQSANMLTIAQEKRSKSVNGDKTSFQQGDIRSVKLHEHFDAVVSMFAVMGYMASNDDFQMALKTAWRHLRPGGLFIFDAWHGSAVLSERPVDRYKIIDLPDERVIRFAHPIIDMSRHTVDVQYRILHIKGDRVLNEVNETHTVRFFFPQEIGFHLKCAGFRLLSLSPFLHSEEPLDEHHWNFSVVALAE